MIPYINTPFDYVAGLLGSATDELKMIFLFLISYPLAGVLKRLPDNKPWTKNVFIISIAVFYLVGLFDLWSGLATIIFDAAGTYLIAKYVQGQYMPWIGFTFLMGHMSISHLYRQIANNPDAVDITGAQMVMIMKLSAFCWNVYDGRQDPAILNADQKERMVVDLPAPLDFAGFVAFFPSIMIGPAFDYVDYHRWLNTTMFDLPPGTDPLKAPPTRKKRKIPRSATPAMWKMATGLLWIFTFLQLSAYFNTSTVLGDKFKNMGFLWRIVHLHMFNLVTRMKYYGAWSLTDGACTLAGIGYKGVDPVSGKPNWDRLINVRPFGVELAQNSHAYLGNWNCNTNHWLRNYMYLRVTPRGQKPGFRASMATFVTSAFWHGFYPGYYLTFLLASFIQNVAKNSRRLLRPFFLHPTTGAPLPRKRYYDIFTWLVTQMTFAFCTSPFILLTIHDSMLVWRRVYFYVPIGVALCSLFLASPGKAWLSKKAKAYGAPGKPQMQRSDSTDSLAGATLGVPSEPGKEFDEMVDAVMAEVEKQRKTKGSKGGAEGAELRKQVTAKLENELPGFKKEL
ncbi:Lysophospholipid acyltransferase [Elasticomyces elasticus]|nr:Lysophospholipid acyltransferase [Elasticomyces elasticus]